MKIVLDDRAHTALRHLKDSDKARVLATIEQASKMLPEQFPGSLQTRKIRDPAADVFVLRASPRFRIIFRYSEEGGILIEDVVSHDLLERTFMRKR